MYNQIIEFVPDHITHSDDDLTLREAVVVLKRLSPTMEQNPVPPVAPAAGPPVAPAVELPVAPTVGPLVAPAVEPPPTRPEAYKASRPMKYLILFDLVRTHLPDAQPSFGIVLLQDMTRATRAYTPETIS